MNETESQLPEIDLSSAEFQDQEESFDFGGLLDWSRAFSRPAITGAIAVLFGLVLLQARSELELEISIALIFLMAAFVGITEAVRSRKASPIEVARIIALVGLAVALLAGDGFTTNDLGLIVGAAVIVWGVVSGFRGIRSAGPGERSEHIIGALLWLAVGAALLLAPEQLMALAVLILAIYWFLGGLLTIAMNLRASDKVFALSSIWPSTMEWLQTRPHTADDRLQLYQQIFYEGTETNRRLSRFFALMSFATAIASFGIISDSTAVVIGAMLVAPLMIPLMGTSLAMVMGWPRRATTSAGVALGGIAVAVGLGIIFGWIYPVEISTTLNSQVASRIGPTLVDLAIAIAAGGAGAFALSRPDVSDSLPGVAVAIALVPPLAVVGLMVSQNDWEAASGALLLFATNLLAILLVGALVFVITGVVPVLQLKQNSKWVRKAVTMVGIVAVLVVGMLSLSTETYRTEIEGTGLANAAIDEWLEGTQLERVSSSISSDAVTATISGPDTPPPVEELATALSDALGKGVDVEVYLIPRTSYEYNSGSG